MNALPIWQVLTTSGEFWHTNLASLSRYEIRLWRVLSSYPGFCFPRARWALRSPAVRPIVIRNHGKNGL